MIKINLSLKKSWTYLILIAVTIPVISLLFWFGFQLYTTQLNYALTIEQQANELLRDQLKSEVSRLKSVLINKTDPLVHLIDKDNALAEINPYLELIIQRESAVKEIIIMSKTNEVIAMIDPYINMTAEPLLTYQQRQNIKSHWSDNLMESPELIIPLMGKEYISSPKQHDNFIGFSIAIPIGKPAKAAMIVMIDINELLTKERLKNTNTHLTISQSYLLDRRGTLLTSVENSHYSIGDLMTHLTIIRTALVNGKWQNQPAYQGINNQPVYGTTTTIPLLNWILVSEVNASKIIYPIWVTLGQGLILVLLSLILFIIFILFLAKKTIRPIDTLVLATQQVSQGNYQIIPNKSGITELDTLIVNFNLMANARKQADEKLKKMAHYDALTQLPNRMLLEERFIKAVKYSQRDNHSIAICYLDLDRFKPVNDMYGHDVGDELLIRVSHRIKMQLQEIDTVSRHGGDEFILLLTQVNSLSQCKEILTSIIETISKPYKIAKQSIVIGASIGVSLYPDDNTDFDNLMRHADQAMYLAKREGRNNYQFFNPEENQQTLQKIIQLKEIESALIHHQFILHYQPKVNMKTGEVFGVESLIRWEHPDKGLLLPAQFLPLTEESELEIKIGRWVMIEALKQLNEWNTQGIEIEVSINISAYYLSKPYFVNDLKKVLSLYPNVNSKHLQLEILESSVLSDLESIKNIIENCIRLLGVNIALDDFGTGYSSLAHLRNLSTQIIKIDQSFIADMLNSPRDYAIVKGVIALAKSFNQNVIAEGVETTEHGLILLLMGCEEMQGYSIAKPMSATDIPLWLINYQPNQQWIAFAKLTRTREEYKKELFQLTFLQWQQNVENMIKSLPESIHLWKKLQKNECHCGIWINSCHQEQLFNSELLNKMEVAHDNLHHVLDDFISHYQAGKIENTPLFLKRFKIEASYMTHILDEYQWFIL